MIEQQPAWRATGLYWNDQIPGIGLADPAGTEHIHQVRLGTQVAYEITGERRCVGVWLPQRTRRQLCPTDSPIQPDSARGQCADCATLSVQFARNPPLNDDRDFGLYLAWFGPAVVKVGLTAAERGTDRLAEQGALAFTWLAHGRLPAIRAAEQAVSAAGLAPERRSRRTKLVAWWNLPNAGHRHQELTRTHRHILDTAAWPAGLTLEPATVIDHVDLFGLNDPPAPCREITQLVPGSVVNGTVRTAAGRDLILDASGGPVLLDARKLAGWPVQPTTAPLTGLTLTDCDYVRSPDGIDQDPLF